MLRAGGSGAVARARVVVALAAEGDGRGDVDRADAAEGVGDGVARYCVLMMKSITSDVALATTHGSTTADNVM